MNCELSENLLRWPLFTKPERVQVLLAVVLMADSRGVVSSVSKKVREYTRLSAVTVSRSLDDLCRFGVVSIASDRLTILLLPDGMVTGGSAMSVQSTAPAGGVTTPAPDSAPVSVPHSSFLIPDSGGVPTPAPAPAPPTLHPVAVPVGSSSGSTRFRRPSLQDVSEVIAARGYHFTAEEFIDYYESVGWVVGRTRKPMKDWKAACRTFERNATKTNKPHSYEQSRETSRAIYLAAEATPSLGGCGAALAAISDDGACQNIVEQLPG